MSEIEPAHSITSTTEQPNTTPKVSEANADGDWWGMLDAEDKKSGHVDSVKLSNKDKSGYLIGRHAECDIVVNHSQVSKRHALVYMEALVGKGGVAQYECFIEDMSANGTFVNGARIEKGKRFKLMNGDSIQLAKNGSSKKKFDDKFWMFIRPKEQVISSFNDAYELTKDLGSGNFATVKLGVHKASGAKSAVKILNKKMFQGNAKVLKNLEQEIGILMAVNHPCIIKIGGVFDLQDTVNIVMEYAKGGELFDRIIERGKFTEDESRILMIQILHALAYLHQREIVHRDLKPENILLATADPEDLRLKISDFGLAKLVTDFTSTLCGTPNYVAPEVLMGKSSRAYGSEVDLWSCGVVLYICLVGQPPFSDELAPPSMMDQIKTGKFSFPSPWWDTISAEAKDLIRKLIVVDPSKRLTALQALNHPWIKNHLQRLSGNAALAQIPSESVAFLKGDTIVATSHRDTVTETSGVTGTESECEGSNASGEDDEIDARAGEVEVLGQTSPAGQNGTVVVDDQKTATEAVEQKAQQQTSGTGTKRGASAVDGNQQPKKAKTMDATATVTTTKTRSQRKKE
ncbi:kinase-like domain-containing protein [Chytriomyces cf. hyalinus JEL632]|nr:kinase-like domain-containing protein [Chytriomyces cf. hyalinus JEL632]